MAVYVAYNRFYKLCFLHLYSGTIVTTRPTTTTTTTTTTTITTKEYVEST